MFDPLNPDLELVNITDIAHALSLLCRANGHFRNFYSVAQHSINCLEEAKERGYSEKSNWPVCSMMPVRLTCRMSPVR